MSMMGNGRMRGLEGSAPVGETVASFTDYARAQKTVSALVAAEVPARDIAIVGTGLRSIERVTGRLGWATAARSGALNGILLGIFFAAIIMIGAPDVPLQLFAGVLFVGIALGMLLGLVSYSFVRRRRDYASIVQVTAEHFEVTVLAKSAHKARQALGRAQGQNDDVSGSGGSLAETAAKVVPTVAPVEAPTSVPTPGAGQAEAPVTAPEAPPQYGERLPSADTTPTR